MLIFHSLQEIPHGFGPSIVTIGNFDGVHRGHQSVFAELIERARGRNALAVAIIFEPHPGRLLRPDLPLQLITPLQQKLELLRATGIDAVLILPFTQQLSQLSALQFAGTVLRDALHAIEVHEGENFRFGRDANADVHTLASLGAELGFTVHVHPARVWRGIPISSSRIRAAIQQGDMRTARQLLGRPFAICSTPAHGRGYGSRHTVPTINLAPYPELLPENGVYITCMQVGDERFEAVTNVGNRPTFGENSFAVESHLLNFHPMELGEATPLVLHFLDRIRAEMHWPSPEALKAQIGRDVSQARHYFALWKAQRSPQTQRL
ncbi:MAG TPA: bifunctional riboflavin kinase/FAD synthetase [Acidobacteriaceae bacterium]|jgi:riboflavin kinase/FMN adenylyltransferase|nr:bifunctional riboflavin kinase/FAD synthetase [Acidobacteriaceae bacterium]